MLSSRANAADSNDATMPGDYESWPAMPSQNRPSRSYPTVGPVTPQERPAPATRQRERTAPKMRHVRHHQRRRRSLTPEVVIERRPHCRSWGRNRVFTIPLDCRPTLGLRGPPKRVLQIERVRCRRRRRCRSLCYDYDNDCEYEYNHPPAQPAAVLTNPIANKILPIVQQPVNIVTNATPAATAISALLANLSQEAIDSLPRQTVRLPPIHLPGSQADANTELHNITFPAEIINPVDGTLSIIQSNSSAINNVATNMIQPTVFNSVQPQLINFPTAVTTIPVASTKPQVSPPMANDPITQRFLELFQRLRIPAINSTPVRPNPPVSSVTLPTMSQFDPSSANTITASPNTLPSNLPASNTSVIGAYRPPTSALTTNTSYRPTTFTSPSQISNPSYRPDTLPYSNSSTFTPYPPANITPYLNRTNQSYGSRPSSPVPSSTNATIPNANSRLNASMTSPLLTQAPYRTINSTPKSILRNASTITPSADVLPTENTFRKAARFS